MKKWRAIEVQAAMLQVCFFIIMIKLRLVVLRNGNYIPYIIEPINRTDAGSRSLLTASVHADYSFIA